VQDLASVLFANEGLRLDEILLNPPPIRARLGFRNKFVRESAAKQNGNRLALFMMYLYV